MIADPGSDYNNRTTDIFISNGIISEIGTITKSADITIDGKNCIATPGLFDLRSRHGEPGHEQTEDVESRDHARPWEFLIHQHREPVDQRLLSD